jgi:hypothetical protein
MGVYIKIFIIMAVLCAVSALPVDEVKEPQIDLAGTDASSIGENNRAGDDLTRDKRHFFGHYGYSKFIEL